MIDARRLQRTFGDASSPTPSPTTGKGGCATPMRSWTTMRWYRADEPTRFVKGAPARTFADALVDLGIWWDLRDAAADSSPLRAARLSDAQVTEVKELFGPLRG